MPCRKTGNKTMNRSEESITRMTSYRLPHYGSSPSHSLRITINVLRHYDTFRFPHYAADPLLLFRMTPNGNHMLRLLTYSYQLIADSSQLIAFIFLPLFLITVIDPSHSLRMTFNVSLTTTANPLPLFRMTPNGNHMLRLLTYN